MALRPAILIVTHGQSTVCNSVANMRNARAVMQGHMAMCPVFAPICQPSRPSNQPICMQTPTQQEATALEGIRIGELLVEQGVLDERQVRHILRVQKATGRPFGDLAERLFGVNPRVIEDAWVEQYIRISGVVDLEQQQIDEECLRRLNRRQAWQFYLLPLHREDDELHMATSPTHLVRAVNFVTHSIDEPVFLRIAKRHQLRDFLMRHYPVPDYIAQYAEKLRK